MVLREGRVLLGQRQGSHGAGEWGLPGGHLEHGESIVDGVLRELREETGLEVSDVQFVCALNTLGYLPKHYVSLGFVAIWKSGEVEALETSEKDWNWYSLDQLPENIFQPNRIIIDAYQSGRTFIDERC